MRFRFALLLTWLGGALLAGGCGGGLPASSLTLVFPDEAAQTQTTAIELFVILASNKMTRCDYLMDGSAKPGDADFEVETRAVFDFPFGGDPELPRVGRGGRLFFARAKGADGAVLLRACDGLETQSDAGREVELVLEWVTD